MRQVAEAWAADKELRDKLKVLDIELGMAKGQASAAVRQWLDSARLIHALLKEAKKQLEAEERARAKEDLCGKVLPEIYERYSGKRFSVPRARDVGALPSIAFVIAAHKAICLDNISPETVRAHWKSARRRASARLR